MTEERAATASALLRVPSVTADLPSLREDLVQWLVSLGSSENHGHLADAFALPNDRISGMYILIFRYSFQSDLIMQQKEIATSEVNLNLQKIWRSTWTTVRVLLFLIRCFGLQLL